MLIKNNSEYYQTRYKATANLGLYNAKKHLYIGHIHINIPNFNDRTNLSQKNQKNHDMYVGMIPI